MNPDHISRRLAALFAGREDPDRVVFASDASRDRTVAITTGWRLHHDARAGLYRLVDAARYPDEDGDLSAARPAVRARLEAAHAAWRERLDRR